VNQLIYPPFFQPPLYNRCYTGFAGEWTTWEVGWSTHTPVSGGASAKSATPTEASTELQLRQVDDAVNVRCAVLCKGAACGVAPCWTLEAGGCV